ncbi:MAG: hypothetical protein Crog4KO_05650 [Crocinitomicaceae bacterium]
MEDRTQHIDDYLNNRLSEEDAAKFERDLEADPNLREELELQQKLQRLLEENERLELKKQVANISQTQSKSRAPKSIIFKVAAIILLLLIPTYFYVSNQYTDSSLYEAYEETYADRVTTMGASDDLQEAMLAYNTEKYKKASILLREIRIEKADERLIIYEAVAYRKSDQPEKAIQLLNKYIPKAQFKETLQWELILNYLAAERGEEAEKTLQVFLKDNSGYKQQQAEALLKDLQSYWR